MKLWELRCASEIPALESNETPKLIGLIVRAEAEAEARELASQEPHGKFGYVWLDDGLTTCVELESLSEGKAGVVMAQWIGTD